MKWPTNQSELAHTPSTDDGECYDPSMWVDLGITLALFAIAATLAYMGVHVTFHPAETPRSKRRYKIGFICLTLSSVPFLVLQAWRVHQSAVELENNIAELRKLTAANTEAVTGGSSFAYFEFDRPFDPAKAIGILVHAGAYTLHDVVVQIFDRNRTSFSAVRRWHDGDVVIGNVPANSAKFFPLMTFDGSDRINVDIVFAAQNGQWAESVRFRRTKDGWVGRLEVRDDKGRTLFERIDPGFPLLEDALTGPRPFDLGKRQLRDRKSVV